MTSSNHRVVAGLLTRGVSVLLCHRRGDRTFMPSVWDLPGGHLLHGEDDRDALVRELDEELGIRISRPTTNPDARIEDPVAGFEILVWAVDAWNGAIRNRAPNEHDEVRWFRCDELESLNLVHPAVSRLASQWTVAPEQISSSGDLRGASR